MPIRPRKKQEVVKRQRQVTDVYLEGWTQHKIAAQLNVRKPIISAGR